MKRIIAIIVLVASVGYVVYSNLFGGFPRGIMMFHHFGYYDDFNFSDYLLQTGLLVVSWSGILFSLLYLFKGFLVKKASPINELDLRLAKGEISVDEYTTLKQEISNVRM